jgi:hypothetical protein
MVTYASTNTSVLNLGMSYFQQPVGGLLSTSGYFLYFQVNARDTWLRPSYGGIVEYNGGVNRLIDGMMTLGIEAMSVNAHYVRPFLGGSALIGWANFASADTSTYVNLIYGGLLSSGVEIRFSDQNWKTGLRITTQYRYVTGSIGGGLSGSDLKAFLISLGLSF